jgi:hypothetical protein
MNLQSLVTDNVSELLVKILEFTENRQIVLTRNINCMHLSGFVPMDLAVDEFSELLNIALEEHICNQRLVLCDTENIKFGVDGGLEVRAIVDDCSLKLLEESRDEYIEEQIDRLLENALNQRVAAELLKDRQEVSALFE